MRQSLNYSMIEYSFPPEFLKFAKEHDLPIILMKPTDADVSKKMKK